MQIRLSDYNVKNDGTENVKNQINQVLDLCKQNPNSELIIDPGTYLVTEKAAIDLLKAVMDPNDKVNTVDSVFQPYCPYVKGLDLTGHQGTKITAYGATLLCDGIMEPITIENAKDIAIEGLTINYRRLPFSQGQITNIQPDYYDIALDQDTPLTGPAQHCRITIWDPNKNRADMTQRKPAQETSVPAPGIFRLHKPIPKNYMGATVVLTHTFHSRPAILLQKSENVTIKNVTIHSQPGMGIVGNRTKNISLHGLRVLPLPGKRLSTNTDATHFTNCTGTIDFRNCQFSCQGDDATNVHGFYNHISTQEETNTPNTYYLTVQVPTHSLVLDAPYAGEEMEIVEYHTMNKIATVKVLNATEDIKNMRTLVTFDQPLPKEVQDNLQNYAAINLTARPALNFIGCHVSTHRARGVLVKTSNVRIEDCTIQETTLQAIHIAVEKYWDEGPASHNVTIRNNRFIRCGYEGTASAILIESDTDDRDNSLTHSDILIEDNVIENEDPTKIPDISVQNAQNVTLRNNRHQLPKDKAVQIIRSKNVTLE